MLNKYKDNSVILPIIWLSFFGSLNINPVEFFEVTYLEKLRLLIPFLLFLLLFFLKPNYQLNTLSNNLIYIFFFVVFFSMLISL